MSEPLPLWVFPCPVNLGESRLLCKQLARRAFDVILGRSVLPASESMEAVYPLGETHLRRIRWELEDIRLSPAEDVGEPVLERLSVPIFNQGTCALFDSQEHNIDPRYWGRVRPLKPPQNRKAEPGLEKQRGKRVSGPLGRRLLLNNQIRIESRIGGAQQFANDIRSDPKGDIRENLERTGGKRPSQEIGMVQLQVRDAREPEPEGRVEPRVEFNRNDLSGLLEQGLSEDSLTRTDLKDGIRFADRRIADKPTSELPIEEIVLREEFPLCGVHSGNPGRGYP